MHNNAKTTRFLLEMSDGFLAETPNTVRENIDAANAWFQGDPRNRGEPFPYSYEFASIDDVESGPLSYVGTVPVGSVEFCAAVANHQGLGSIPALNIPTALRSKEFLARQAFDAPDDKALWSLITEHDSIFVKPGDTAKRFDTTRVDAVYASDFLRENPGPYFVSTLLPENIVAEWRVFFYRGRIVAARPYVLDEWVAPNKMFILKALEAWDDKPPAGTLNVAVLANESNIVTANRTNVVIEAHPFIACGLYGFEGEIVLKMMREAWRWLAERDERAKGPKGGTYV